MNHESILLNLYAEELKKYQDNNLSNINKVRNEKEGQDILKKESRNTTK